MVDAGEYVYVVSVGRVLAVVGLLVLATAPLWIPVLAIGSLLGLCRNLGRR